MPSNSFEEIQVVFMKEWRAETRSLSGLTTTALICLVSIVIVNTITWTTSINPMISAGLYWLTLVFSGSITLPRTFLIEEENRSADFWRLVSRPEAVFYGKALFNMVQMLIATLFVTVGFVVMIQVKVVDPKSLILNAIGGAVAISSTATLAGAIAAPANNRSSLATAISAPLLCFMVNMGITGTAFSFGEGLDGGNLGFIAMIAYAVAATVIGPEVYSRIWKS
jgi:heme exporter protein B